MAVPQTGQFVLVRRRPAMVRNQFPFNDDATGRELHVIDVEYIDGYEYPSEDRVIWEREIGAKAYKGLDYPEIENQQSRPDTPGRYHAFLDALKWSSNGIYELSEGEISHSTASILSPWFSAIKVEDYQLYPVLEALSLPRVNLLLADDVGLGKTIEAGLIIQELIRQRRIRRILIVCPSSLQIQWQDEMAEKFNIDFTVMDSEQAFATQRELGMDANPWTVYPKIITSMDYLKQADVLGKFRTGTEHMLPQDSAMLPWDLLIVDEAHNFMPSRFSDESKRYSMLRDIAPFFEHKLFLTATPHNGYTVSFSGILELLDPVRFQQKTTLDEEDYKHLGLVMVRRMKKELNIDPENPRFPERYIQGIPLKLTAAEENLYGSMRRYRLEATKELAKVGKREKALGGFIFSLLTKRLLSSSYSFARTWWNHVAGFGLKDFDIAQATESKKRAEMPVDDDDEKDRRENDALRHGAGWLKNYGEKLRPYIDEVSAVLMSLGWSPEVVGRELAGTEELPPDRKWEHLLEWVERNVKEGKRFRKDERLILFTEYKDTLNYLLHRFRQSGIGDPEIQTLFGGAPANHRRRVKEEFNNPLSQLRILLATDAASEGLNLQTSCRYVIHQEIPWNPMRMEQRNGRVDRHGQARDVTVFHFASDQVEDINFLAFVAAKVHTIRGDLGSTGKVLDEAVMEHFTTGRVSREDIEERMKRTDKYAQDKKDLDARNRGSVSDYEKAMAAFRDTREKLGFDEARLARLLAHAAILEGGEIRETEPGTYRFSRNPPNWDRVIRNTVALHDGDRRGAQPKLVFSPERVETVENGRSMFRPPNDTKLLMLGHPVMGKALSAFRKRLWAPSGQSNLNRWTVVTAELPRDIDVIFVVSFQISMRNMLGERFSVGILDVPVVLSDGREYTQATFLPAVETSQALSSCKPRKIFEVCTVDNIQVNPERSELETRESEPMADRFGEVLMETRSDWLRVKDFIEGEKERILVELSTRTGKELKEQLGKEIKEQKRMFKERSKALEMQKNPKALERLRKELMKAEKLASQLTFSEELNARHQQRYSELKEKAMDAEWERQHGHVELLKKRLERERTRVLEMVLPKRYALAEDGIDVQVAGVEVIVGKGVRRDG